MDRIITGIELGERRIRVAVGRHRPGSTRMLACVEAASAGIEDKVVADAPELAAILNGVARKLRTTVHFPLENVVFVVPASRLRFHETEASIRPSGARGTVTAADGHKVVAKSSPAFASSDRRLIHVIPQAYILDGKETEHLPVGKTGQELTVFSMSISCDASTVALIQETARIVGSENSVVMAESIAESYAALTETERERGAAVLSIGERISTVTVMHYGQYIGSAKISVGTHHFTDDLAVALDLPYPTAQAVIDQAATFSNAVGLSREPVSVTEDDLDIDRGEMVATLRNRAEGLFSLTEGAITEIAMGRELPGGLAIAGQPTLRDGFTQLAKTSLAMPIHWAGPRGIEGIPLTISDNASWVPAIGALAWAGTLTNPLDHPWFNPVPSAHDGKAASPLRRLARRLSRRNGAGAPDAESLEESSDHNAERTARRKNAAVARGNGKREQRREIARV